MNRHIKKLLAIAAGVLALLVVGCDYFNVSMDEFIEMRYAKVRLKSVDFGVQMGEGNRFMHHPNSTPQDYLVPISLDNTHNLNIKATITSASVNGDPAPGVTIASCTKNQVVVKIAGADVGQSYSIALRITSKDGVARGERIFDIQLPQIVFGFGGAVKWEGHNFYASLKDAVDAITAAGAGTETNPDEITVFTDINMAVGGNIVIPSGKNVKLISDATQRTLKRASGNTAALITVNGQLTLENIIVDGGAVWTGGTAAPPSPAFGATNAGLNAANTLVLVNGGSAKLTLGAGAVLQNNYSEGGSIPDNLGGGIRATGGAQVVINGAGAAVRYNFAGWTGGGIALFDSPAQQGTKLTLINGSIDNNKANWGGGITTEYGSIDMRGGFVTKNYASSAGGGINFSNCNNGLTASISGGSISENRADYGGGIRIEKQWAITMSGSAVISGNTATATLGGGGVYMESGTFTMSGSAIISGNTATTNGGGVTVVKTGTVVPVFTLEGNALISGNTATGNGGGVVLENGSLTLSGSAKITNNTSGFDGGGVNVKYSAAQFTMNGGEITGNSAASSGAAVWVGNGGRFTMTDGVINANTGEQSVVAWHSGTVFAMSGGRISGTLKTGTYGSGVHVNESATLNMSGGEISGNTMASEGGGVRLDGGIFNMSGTALIKGNAASGNGGGLHIQNGSFTMSGGTIYGSGESSALRNTAANGASLYKDAGSAQYSDASEISSPNNDTLTGH